MTPNDDTAELYRLLGDGLRASVPTPPCRRSGGTACAPTRPSRPSSETLRETLAGQSDTLGSFAYALANLTYYGGGDSLEGVRAMAGDEHTEQWLKLEGDDTRIGRRRHRDLKGLLRPGTPVVAQEEALADQEARLLRLQDEQHLVALRVAPSSIFNNSNPTP